jgi:hypothetical protein
VGEALLSKTLLSTLPRLALRRDDADIGVAFMRFL